MAATGSKTLKPQNGLPLSVSTREAHHHEVALVQLSFDFYIPEAKPEYLTVIASMIDNDGLGGNFKQKGVNVIDF